MHTAEVHSRLAPAWAASSRIHPGDYAGRLIEAAGLKGLSLGGAQVSSVHANFLVNRGVGASASDYLALIEMVRTRVKRRFNVALELEIQVLGDW